MSGNPSSVKRRRAESFSSLSSSSFSSGSSSDDICEPTNAQNAAPRYKRRDGRTHRHNGRHRSSSRNRNRKRDRYEGDHNKTRHDDDRRHKKKKHSDNVKKLPPAPSDWEELRSHFQFVLPTDSQNELHNEHNEHNEHSSILNEALDAACPNPNESNLSNQTSSQTPQTSPKYGSTWQERMVQQYHSKLYKEYVLADLSRVSLTNGGQVGLRWRMEKEVVNGRGFRTCGNLKCASLDGGLEKLQDVEVEMGEASKWSEGNDFLGQYLKSCDKERTKLRQIQMEDDKRNRRKKHKHKHSKKSKHPRRDSQYSQCTPHHLERKEQKRLASMPHGIGLHDYEVDFVYVEQGVRKRELVKVRLCLRCAPLLFASKNGRPKRPERPERPERPDSHGRNENKDGKGPATKAREARETAARDHAMLVAAENKEAAKDGIDGSAKHQNDGMSNKKLPPSNDSGANGNIATTNSSSDEECQNDADRKSKRKGCEGNDGNVAGIRSKYIPNKRKSKREKAESSRKYRRKRKHKRRRRSLSTSSFSSEDDSSSFSSTPDSSASASSASSVS